MYFTKCVPCRCLDKQPSRFVNNTLALDTRSLPYSLCRALIPSTSRVPARRAQGRAGSGRRVSSGCQAGSADMFCVSQPAKMTFGQHYTSQEVNLFPNQLLKGQLHCSTTDCRIGCMEYWTARTTGAKNGNYVRTGSSFENDLAFLSGAVKLMYFEVLK